MVVKKQRKELKRCFMTHSTSCSSRSSSHLSVTLVPEYSKSSGFLGHQAQTWYIELHEGKILIHRKKKFLSKNVGYTDRERTPTQRRQKETCSPKRNSYWAK